MTIMKRSGAAALLGAIFLALSGSAQARGFDAGRSLFGAHVTSTPVQRITVINHANVRTVVLRRIEAAIQYQVNTSLHRTWRTPKIAFAPGGWRVVLQRENTGACPDGAEGCHWPSHGTTTVFGSSDGSSGSTFTGKFDPFAVVFTQGETWQGMSPTYTVSLDHEVIEMLVDPTLSGDEPCDDDNVEYEAANGTMLTGFEPPSYFR